MLEKKKKKKLRLAEFHPRECFFPDSVGGGVHGRTSECRRRQCRRRKGRGELGGERAGRKEEKKKRWHQKTLTWLQGRRVKEAVQAPVPLLEPRDPSDSRSRSGMPSRSGLGVCTVSFLLASMEISFSLR